jgi:hypothetical protein
VEGQASTKGKPAELTHPGVASSVIKRLWDSQNLAVDPELLERTVVHDRCLNHNRSDWVARMNDRDDYDREPGPDQTAEDKARKRAASRKGHL